MFASSSDQRRAWLLTKRGDKLERDLSSKGLGHRLRESLESELRAVRGEIRRLRATGREPEETGVPLADHVQVGGTWVALEDAVAAIAHVPCSGFVRSERLPTFWAERVVRFCSLPITGVADDGHLLPASGDVRIAVLSDPWEGDELRSRVVTRAARTSVPGFEVREMVLVPNGEAQAGPQLMGDPPSEDGTVTDEAW